MYCCALSNYCAATCSGPVPKVMYASKHRVTAHVETNTKLTSAWQDQLDQASQYISVPYSSHSAHSSRISVQMDASPLTLHSIAALVCEETRSGLYKMSERVIICHVEVKRK